jgi:hypothetical protein
MRPKLLIVLSGLALGAAACAGPSAAPPPPAPTPTGAPQPVADHDWFLHQDGETARLVYGLAESDDLRLGLDCERGSGQLELSAPGEDDDRRIALESGGETEIFPARAEPSELHDGVFLTARAPADAPVFLRFRRLGWLAIWRGGERQAYAPHPGSADGVERFFAFCG